MLIFQEDENILIMKNTRVTTNRQYKDRLFRLLFGSEERKDSILSLYNAINNTSYTECDEMEITTLEDVVYIKMKNDVSLLIDSYLPLWEQQSSYNPNMPIRGLMYFGNLYSAYIDGHKLNIYGEKLVKIPTPQYIVFYNGSREIEDVRKLKLSDAFINDSDSNEFQWTATMYNLNKGKNIELLAKCKPLADYMTLINYIRDNQEKGMSVEDSIDNAVTRCIIDGIMVDFLEKHRAEVMDVCITEYNEKVFVNGILEDGRRKEIFDSVEDGDYGIARGAQKLGISEKEFIRQMKEAGYSIPESV